MRKFKKVAPARTEQPNAPTSAPARKSTLQLSLSILRTVCVLGAIGGGVYAVHAATDLFGGDEDRSLGGRLGKNGADFGNNLLGLEKEKQNTVDAGHEDGVTYHITIATGNDGTDANVALTLVGANGEKTAPQILNSHIGDLSSNAFEVNDEEIITFEAQEDVGVPTRIEIQSDGSGPKPEWNVRYIRVRHETLGDAYFYPPRNIGGSQPGGITLYDEPPRLEYVVTINTGDNGTDSNVSLTFNGTQGRYGAMVNPKLSGNALEAGDVDTFVFDSNTLGEPESVYIVLDELTAFRDSWTPSSIVITQGPNQWRANINQVIEEFEPGGFIPNFDFHRVR